MGEKARILIVDDEESIRKVLATILEEEGYKVETAINGKDALKKSKDGFYNLALLDIRLPDLEGTELLSTMKETTPKMIKIIMTGYPSLQNAVEALNQGADAYILKPFKVEDVLQTIKDQLGKQSESRRYSEERVAEFILTRAKELEVMQGKPLK
jgi:DNA-binding NtrC family response regulator